MKEMGLGSSGAKDDGGGGQEAHCNDGRGKISSGQAMKEGMRHAEMTEVGLCSSRQTMKGGKKHAVMTEVD